MVDKAEWRIDSRTLRAPTRNEMLQWGLTRWLIASAAAVGSLLGVTKVCGDVSSKPETTTVGSSVASASADRKPAEVPVGRLLIDIESAEPAARRASAEALAASKDS